jgi:hypothetical protein
MTISEDSWKAFEYEVWMFFETRTPRDPTNADDVVANALAESALLHTRVLVEALIDKNSGSDDVNLRQLLAGISTSPELLAAQTALKAVYGTSGDVNSPCWILNKRLAHLTNVRGDSFDYGPLRSVLDPLVFEVLREVAAVTMRPVLCHYAQ